MQVFGTKKLAEPDIIHGKVLNYQIYFGTPSVVYLNLSQGFLDGFGRLTFEPEDNSGYHSSMTGSKVKIQALPFVLTK